MWSHFMHLECYHQDRNVYNCSLCTEWQVQKSEHVCTSRIKLSLSCTAENIYKKCTDLERFLLTPSKFSIIVADPATGLGGGAVKHEISQK